jgi:hypothetical protein
MPIVKKVRFSGISRREFLKISSVSAAGVSLLTPAILVAEDAPLADGPTFATQALRIRDFLNLRFEFFNLVPDNRLQRLGKVDLCSPAFVAVIFPPQNLAEGFKYEELKDGVLQPLKFTVPIRARISGPSRLVFKLPDDQDAEGYPLQLEELLKALRQSKLLPSPKVVDFIKDSKFNPTKRPGILETSLELPYRIFLSTDEGARFFHLIRPQTTEWVELWHSGLDLSFPNQTLPLAPRPVSVSQQTAPVDDVTRESLLKEPVSRNADPRGLIYPIFTPAQPKDEIEYFPPCAEDRQHLVDQMSRGDGVMRARELILTSLGASTDLQYDSTVNKAGGLRQWVHRSAIGRDFYIKVVTNGYLLPFGHKAAYVRIWERKLNHADTSNGDDGAYMLARQFIVVLTPDKDFLSDDSTTHVSANRICRGMPLKWVSITDERTPNLCVSSETEKLWPSRPTDSEVIDCPSKGGRTFWVSIMDGPEVNGAKTHPLFQFNLKGRDEQGNRCEFTMPMVYTESLEEGSAFYNLVASTPPQDPAAAGEANLPKVPLSVLDADQKAAKLRAAKVQYVPKLDALFTSSQLTGEICNEIVTRVEKSSVLHADWRKVLDLKKDTAKLVDRQTKAVARFQTLLKLNEFSSEAIGRVLKADFIGMIRAYLINGIGSAWTNPKDEIGPLLKDIFVTALNLAEVGNHALQVWGELDRSFRAITDQKSVDFFKVIGTVDEFAEHLMGEILKVYTQGASKFREKREIAKTRFDAFLALLSDRKDFFNGTLEFWAKTFTLNKLALEGSVRNYLNQFLQRTDVKVDELKTFIRTLPGAEDLPDLQNAINQLEGGTAEIQNAIQEVLKRYEIHKEEIIDRLQTVVNPTALKRMLLNELVPSLPADLEIPDPAIITHSINFLCNRLEEKKEELLSQLERYYPRLDFAKVEIPALKQINPTMPVIDLRPLDQYIDEGFANYARVNGEIKSEIQGARQGIYASLENIKAVGANIQAAVLSPALQISGLSREIGSVIAKDVNSLKALAIAEIGKGAFSIKDCLADAKLFGNLKLSELVRELDDLAEMPKILTRQIPGSIETRWNWNKVMERFDFQPLLPITFDPKGLCFLSLSSVMSAPLPDPLTGKVSGRATATLSGHLDQFSIEIAEMIKINFGELSFHSGTDQPFKVDPQITGVEFEGPLKFVAQLQEMLKNLTGAVGLVIDVLENSIAAGLSLHLPDIGVGIFSLTNISFQTKLMLPLGSGNLAYRFSFCERSDPFTLSVAGFAGGGFLAVEISSGEYRMVEGALEFGGSLSFNVVVASGGLHVMGGLYFRISTKGNYTSGYLRAGGSLRVLGIISASVEFMLSMTCYSQPHKSAYFYGRAELTIHVEILFFSKDVSISMERTFAGSSSASQQAMALPRRHLLDQAMFAANLPTEALPTLISHEGAALAEPCPSPAIDLDQNLLLTDQMEAEDWQTYWSAF